jgi:hypothetical protein
MEFLATGEQLLQCGVFTIYICYASYVGWKSHSIIYHICMVQVVEILRNKFVQLSSSKKTNHDVLPLQKSTNAESSPPGHADLNILCF